MCRRRWPAQGCPPTRPRCSRRPARRCGRPRPRNGGTLRRIIGRGGRSRRSRWANSRGLPAASWTPLTVAALAAELAATLDPTDLSAKRRGRGLGRALGAGRGLGRHRTRRRGAAGFTQSFASPVTTAPVARRPSARPSATLSALASLGALAGSLLLRVSIMGAGDKFARRPDISFRFAQPGNLPGHETTSSV